MDPTTRYEDERRPRALNDGYSFEDFQAARAQALERLRVQSEVFRLESLYALPPADEDPSSR